MTFIFPSTWALWELQTPQNKGKHKMTNWPALPPHSLREPFPRPWIGNRDNCQNNHHVRFLRFSLPKVPRNLTWNFGESFRMPCFPGFWVSEMETFTKAHDQKRCQQQKISRKFHSAWGGGGADERGGFKRGVFRNSWRAGFSLRGNLLLHPEFLLEFDASLAIVTSGLMTNLLLQEQPPWGRHLLCPTRKIKTNFGSVHQEGP